MRQFRDLPIFVSSPDIPDSERLPRTKPLHPGSVYPGVGNYYPDEISGDDAIYETRLIDLLDRITQQEVGRLLLSLLPNNYPILITKMTAADIQRLGDCNGETGASADTISLYGAAFHGHVRIIFTPNFTPDCSTSGPAQRPHEKLFHELVHAYDLALHGGTFLKIKIRGGGAGGYDIGQYFDDTEEFTSILVTNIFISEYSLDLRFHHHGHARLPSEFATSSAFCEKFRPVIKLLARDNRRLMNMLSFLNQSRFNPLKEYFKDGHDMYVKDFFPG